MPDYPFKRYWDIMIALIIMYSAIVLPYKIAFVDTNEIVWIDVTMDIIFAVDIFINFFSAYIDSEDNVVKNRKKIVKTYLKSWFIIDLVSVLPIQYFTSASQFNNLTRIGRLPKLYRLLKLTKLFRMAKIVKRGNVNRVTKFFLEKLKVNANIERLIYFILAFLLLNHFSACIWYFMAKLQDLSPDCWVTRLGYIDSTNFEIYVVAFYWTLTTVTTVGYGDVNAGTTIERVYNLFIMSFGVLMYSFAIGSLSSIVSTLDAKTAEMNQKLQILSSIKKEFNLDQEIYDKVRKVIKYDLSRNQKDKMNFLQELPNKLRIELSQIMHDKVIQNLYFFRDQPSDFIAYVAPLLKPVKFSQNDYLYKIGDMIDEMYFVSKGTVIFCLGKSHSEKEIKEIKKNNNFGEIEMCLNEKLSFNIKIKSRNCELFVLKKNDFLRLSVNFKEFIENFLHKSLMIYLRFNEEKKKLIKEYDNLVNGAGNNPDGLNKNTNTGVNEQGNNHADLEMIDEKEEEEGSEEYDIYSENISEESNNNSETDNKSDKDNSNKKEDENKDDEENKSIKKVLAPLNKSSSETGNNLFINHLLSKKNTINRANSRKSTHKSVKKLSLKNNDDKYSEPSSNEEKSNNNINKSNNQDHGEHVDKLKNQINKKFVKKIDKILEYLEKNNIAYPQGENNPKLLLKQLKNENDIIEKNNIIDKIETILKDIYK
jgi:hypothetical protein